MANTAKDVKEEKEIKKTKQKTTEGKTSTKKATASKAKKEVTKKAPEKKQKKEISKKTTQKKVEPETKDFDTIYVDGYNHLRLYTYVFDRVENPKAVVVIVHGMQEHAGRYQDFAKFLNKNGYIVIMNDLRGHGHTMVSKDKYGCGENDIYTECIQDEIILIKKAKEAYNLPIYLFGHSYGSMVSQGIIQNTDVVEKCVLCGTADGSSLIMQAGGVLANIIAPFKKSSSRGGMMEKMCVAGYGKKFDNGNWLTRDEASFAKYKEDELCGGTFPFSFYKSMLSNMRKRNKGIGKIGKKKVFIIGGAKDPVGSCGKQIKSLNKRYLKHNIDSKYKVYPDCRHELLNEINKEEIYNDILDFYEN